VYLIVPGGTFLFFVALSFYKPHKLLVMLLKRKQDIMPSVQYYDDECSESSFDIDRVSKTASLRSKIPLRRSVGFENDDEVWEIPHFKDLSEEEAESIWMSKQELKAVRKHCLELVQKMNSSASLGDDSPRGLENYIKCNVDKIKKIRKSATESVLGLQKFQSLKGVRVATLMAELYANKAGQSQHDAHIRGLGDEDDALEAHRWQ
jgi:hypothetical protein